MARGFVRASSQYLQRSSAVISSPPFTMACWFYSDDLTVAQTLIEVGESIVDNRHDLILAGTVGGDPLRARSVDDATSGSASSSVGYSANTWQHACGVWSASNNRVVYLNGGNSGSNTTSVVPESLDKTAVGRRTSGADYMSGRIAEVAIWSAALTAVEVAALARGISPPYVRPTNLVDYWPLWGLHSPEIDLTANNRTLTVTGATAANHAPTQPFSHRRWMAAQLAEEAGTAGQPSHLRWGGVPYLALGPRRSGRSW